MKLICLDSSAWIALAHDGPNAAKFARAMADAEQVLVSAISIYEIARYTTRVAGDAATEKLLAFVSLHPVAPVSDEIATLAAALGARHQLAMADALIYATCIFHHAELWTQDADFNGLPHVKCFPVPT
jgi:predicted nucleic acid-binding protein